MPDLSAASYWGVLSAQAPPHNFHIRSLECQLLGRPSQLLWDGGFFDYDLQKEGMGDVAHTVYVHLCVLPRNTIQKMVFFFTKCSAH